MAEVKIKRELGRLFRSLLRNAIILLPPIVLFIVALIWALFAGGEVNGASGVIVFLLLFGLLTLYTIALGIAFWRLANLDRHPDLVLLSRYGSLSDLLPAIEAELADPKQVARVGRMNQSFRVKTELGGYQGQAEVWFSPSWLVYVTGAGSRMKFFQLDSILVAARIENKVWLVDQYNTTLEIPGTEAGVTRLLAEILMRVPWALNHFDPGTENNSAESRQQIIAQVDQRRTQFKASQPDNEPPGLSRRSGVQGPPG